MSLNLQWGFVEIDKCYSCSTYEELWVHSGMEAENSPRCIGCLLERLHKAISECEYQMNNNGTENHDDHRAVLYGLRSLLQVNPTNSPEVFGERPQICNACYGVAYDESNPLIEVLNSHNEVVKVHKRCSHTCEACELDYMRAVSISWRLAQRLPLNTFSIQYAVTFKFFAPEGEWLCTSCVQNKMSDGEGVENYFQCNNCESYDFHTHVYWFDDETYCENCYEDNVVGCSSCDELYWVDSGHDCPYDDDCDDEYSVIHSYDYRPRPTFFGHRESRYFLGFELEVEAFNASRSEGALIAQNGLGEHAYMKQDGSLNDGFEIVTHPHTLEAYKELNWEVLDQLRRSGYRSWNTETCGLHVHVSRTAFGSVKSTHREIVLSRQAHELRFMKLVYDNQRQVERLAGRPSNHYASFVDKGKLVRKVKFGTQSNGRYSVINTENDNTIEVRIFRGSLKKETVMSALEFVTASVEYTRNLKVTASNKALSWSHFVAYVVSNAETYPNLLAKMNASFERDTITDDSYSQGV